MITRRDGLSLVVLLPWIATVARAQDKGLSFGEATRRVIGLQSRTAIVAKFPTASFYVDALSIAGAPDQDISRAKNSIAVADKYSQLFSESDARGIASAEQAQILQFEAQVGVFVSNLEKIGIANNSIAASLILDAIAAVFIVMNSPPVKKEISNSIFCISPFCQGRDPQ